MRKSRITQLLDNDDASTEALARFNNDGTLDTSFGTSGTATASLSTTAQAMHPQPNGKIVAAGTSAGEMAVARYDTSGTLDTTFDTDGDLTIDMGSVEIGNAL